MVKKPPPSHPPSSGAALGGTVKDSAQQILQAGLGAFAKAQVESVKALENLVKDSAKIQRRTKAAAEEKLSEATSRMTHMANDITSKASGQWDKLENIFEERVAKALGKLGVPSAKDVAVLLDRIETLQQAVQALTQPTTGAAPSASAPPKPRRARVAAASTDTPAAAKTKAAPKRKSASAKAAASRTPRGKRSA
ncbi:MAG: phasin family protein [Rhodoferax sp.]